MGIENVANKARSTRGADKQHRGPDGKVKAYPKTKVTERWRAGPASLGRIPIIHEEKERYVKIERFVVGRMFNLTLGRR